MPVNQSLRVNYNALQKYNTNAKTKEEETIIKIKNIMRNAEPLKL